MTDLLYRDECYKVVGACMEVYKDKGCGFLEADELRATGHRLGLLVNSGHLPEGRMGAYRRLAASFVCFVVPSA